MQFAVENPKLVDHTTLEYKGKSDVPDAVRLSGNPSSESWSCEPLPGGKSVRYGLWMGEPGAIALAAYPNDEFFTVIDGRVQLENRDGSILDVRSGETCLIRRNWAGVWRTVEKTHKVFVVIVPDDQG
ncbi:MULTISPECIES: cupin domain-containing protein [Alphaproteobacteria]|uniref:Cupin n=2 Tax=Alphaproteobacteria TaxID=28211 RepID=A0A512HN22_9HYPH|nr:MULTISPECIES: cupin domain-containing protein [Alphaproteobacteria]GEO86842.1 cupin [Ciceribacter naphthalenivorans]GLR23986.1 cupin [Ciceribacter naphthalenivorans]GLT06842.1 cupin [Sphingomonas psychrolutea]